MRAGQFTKSFDTDAQVSPCALRFRPMFAGEIRRGKPDTAPSAAGRLGCAAAGKTCDRHVKAAPQEMHRTALADEAAAKHPEHAVCVR